MEFFSVDRLVEQKLVKGCPFPLLILPMDVSKKDPESLASAIHKNRQWLDDCLLQCRAMLFRGFELNNALDFDKIVKAFGYREHKYEAGEDERETVVGRVLTVNFSSSVLLSFHNEMAYLDSYPDILMFFCDVEPAVGGNTPIVSGLRVLERMTQEWPDFVAKLREKGVTYVKYYEAKDKDKAIARSERTTSTTLEFLPDGRVIETFVPRSGIAKEVGSGLEVFFNSMAVVYLWKGTHKLCFGDGSEMPVEALDAYLRILDEEKVSFQWKKGDVLVLDNIATMHAREKFKPPRLILASLCNRTTVAA
ncbi:hypothetical protein O6H91_20G051400 [Diphasiastrum complanatum]|uniref:Uncharacterized protein n=3 Tax=Diphasiastrum complanatum TaxID=34168 RepID=A0ACC2AQH8_DIPCM|nr:hypothetical protein O6H91_20G051200 [Diphasiastrum complanatum]KAJ7519697.1 hypothetical protein O6H91_20G051400 [Diphasiastrum complanatum]KAJ7519698.1 hypothetical protein O6H91_20G051400 [Diphasiastrum complanatum]